MSSDQETTRNQVEAAIEPEMIICDPHHHLWEHPNNRYLLEDLLDDIGPGHRVVRTVFVECRSKYRTDGPEDLKPVGETEFVREQAAESRRETRGKIGVIEGIVGFADLTLGERAAPVLEAHLQAGGSLFKGIRHSVAWDASQDIASYRNPPPGLLLDPAFRQGFALLGKHGLSFDAWLYHPQIPELTDLARAFPQVTIILDHIGAPLGIGPYSGRRDEIRSTWNQAVADLAACPNVAVKLGGLGMPLCGFGWQTRSRPVGSDELAEAMKPYYGWCIEKFGAGRCMFESNFPVDKSAYAYTVMWNAFKRMTAGFSPAERAALFHDTAVRVYRLDAA
jgi:predicted TIM-barrel fold metal-dependent hydrolase